ncbi:amino acid adenylation domain-containing protein [Amycolatopsis pigmentata]|uniref:Amino acid adenylation domain-containing protein n=1 Tax=Amycolatopsis pigmentata TaxID=450801 RepID=A0ABW5G0G1_9PSEU
MRENPDRVAVRDRDRSLTYRQLADRATSLAARLRADHPTPGARVGLYLNRTVDLVTAVVATTVAGHAYVPLDPAYPEARLRFTVDDSGIAAVITDQDTTALGTALKTIRLDEEGFADEPPPAPDDLPDDVAAYVIYTSGSTGRPKGVEVRQRNVVALVTALTEMFDHTADDVWTLFHSYCFDFSVWEIWGALITGGTLVVVPAEVAISPEAILSLLTTHRVTVLNVVPSVFRHLAAALRRVPAPPGDVRRVIFGGEAIDLGDIRAWRAATGSGCEFVNGYGVTEATVFATMRTLSAFELDAPGDDHEFARELGTPLRGWDVRVRSEDGTDVPVGATGEIWVGGAGVATGYVNRPELTADRFLGDGGFYRTGDLAIRRPGDVFHYAGRADDQVKLNGYRIELGEIESVLRRLPGIRDIVVVRGVSRIGVAQLVAYYVVDPAQPDPDLAGYARAQLPRYMVPARFVRQSELPLTPSGKTDRRALAEAG